MKWSLLVLASVLSLAGCQNRQPVMNPFLGPTVVPPPATGAAAPGAAPYYQGSPPPGSPPPAYSAPGSLPPAGAYNPQVPPPAGATFSPVPGTIPGTQIPSATPTYAPPPGNNNYRQAIPGGSNTRVAPAATDAFAARTGNSNVRVASSDVVHLDQSIPVSPVVANQGENSVRTLGSEPSNEPAIQVPTDSKPDRLQMEPVGGIRRVSYDTLSEPGNSTSPPRRPLFSAPPLPYQNRNSSAARTQATRSQAARAPVMRAPIAQRPAVNVAAASRRTPRVAVAEPRRFTQPPAMVEISDLPLAGPRRSPVKTRGQVARQPAVSPAVVSKSSLSVAPASRSRVSSYQASAPLRASNSQPTRAASPSTGRTIVAASSPRAQPSPRYGHDPDYRWVTGKLEYSRIKRQWKLRYIPIDGKTDNYGGSVLIANEEALQAFQAGDYVALQGSIIKTESNSRSFAPKYQVSRAKPLSN